MTDDSEYSTSRREDDHSRFIERLRSEDTHEDTTAEVKRLHGLLLAQAPRAVLAQAQMDKHKRGYHNREKRLYELIDFNDTFVSLVLATPHKELPGLAERLERDMASVCERLKQRSFSPEQYDAIVRGLSREIAVYRSAKYMGFGVSMTSRVEDAFGIDMVVVHPKTDQQLNIDCKTPPAFRRRLEELVDHERITDQQLLAADRNDYIIVEQRRGQESIPVTLLCIRSDTLGEIHDFAFDEPERLKKLLNNIFASAS